MTLSKKRRAELEAVEYHPLAMMFPRAPDAEVSELRSSIAVVGQLTPCLLYEGKILDGRHRWECCLELGIEPDSRDLLPEEGPVPTVIAANLRRRHLTPSQAAAVAAELATLEHGQHKTGHVAGLTQAEAAAATGASERSTRRAARVREAAPDLHEQVKAGKLDVGTAEQLALLPEEERHDVVAKGPEEIRRAAAQAREERLAKRRAPRVTMDDPEPEGRRSVPTRGVFEVARGDVRSVLPFITSGIVQTCITSIPYWRQRDYGFDGQLGLEEVLEEYIANQVAVFREVRRLQHPSGTLWLNMGDKYAGSGGAGGDYNKEGFREGQRRFPATKVPDLANKNLVGVPWRLALALQSDGWILRGEIIWEKTNPSPTGVSDRPLTAHEHVFLFSVGPEYYFDFDAIRTITGREATWEEWEAAKGSNAGADSDRLGAGYRKRSVTLTHPLGRGPRTVWRIPSNRHGVSGTPYPPFPGKHYAAFPPALVERCLVAGSRPGDLVLDPYSGTATTGVVAVALGRRYFGVEGSEEYATKSLARLGATPVPAEGQIPEVRFVERQAEPSGGVPPHLLELLEGALFAEDETSAHLTAEQILEGAYEALSERPMVTAEQLAAAERIVGAEVHPETVVDQLLEALSGARTVRPGAMGEEGGRDEVGELHQRVLHLLLGHKSLRCDGCEDRETWKDEARAYHGGRSV